MPVTATSSAPYAPARAILEIVMRYREKGLPQPINEDVLSRIGISESLIPRTLQSLQTLDLINDKGAVTDIFDSLRLAPENEFKERMAQWLNAAYSDVLKFIDPSVADETALKDAFQIYNPPGQRDRMVTLFVGLYAAAGIGPEKTKSRSARPRGQYSSSTGASKRQNGKPAGEENGASQVENGAGEAAGQKQNSGVDQKAADHPKSFERELLAKFPEFNPAWDDTLKAKWFEGFEKFMALMGPK